MELSKIVTKDYHHRLVAENCEKERITSVRLILNVRPSLYQFLDSIDRWAERNEPLQDWSPPLPVSFHFLRWLCSEYVAKSSSSSNRRQGIQSNAVIKYKFDTNELFSFSFSAHPLLFRLIKLGIRMRIATRTGPEKRCRKIEKIVINPIIRRP